ncbi:hypothetical protein AVEN_60934-1 [Araneus ventricosus]|uniref:Receptor ligand binding region domain-containing protein n=1 Tax=Araneus ventricosus TaxID=182803 RepID=A0A4Y2RDG7_ARAVE|nr:hypothetical protein AVEN_60934-1 [Araneus ventricosus]
MIGSRSFWHLVVLICAGLSRCICKADTFTVGYLTGSERRPGNEDYHRPGLSISGAITLAVDEINHLHPLVDGHKLNFTIAETYGDEEESILQVALLWTQNIAGYIGPQETCVHEAKMASGFNLPMISYVSRIRFSFPWCRLSVSIGEW